jgi:hypothetical protein
VVAVTQPESGIITILLSSFIYGLKPTATKLKVTLLYVNGDAIVGNGVEIVDIYNYYTYKKIK